MITVIADEGIDRTGYELYEELTVNGMTTEYISLEGVKVKPCVNCGGCTYKTYGKCVVRDDADWILKNIIGADVLIMVTPITFGGYSYKIKQVLDKISLIMDRHYYIRNKEMVKGGMHGRQFKFFVLGINTYPADTTAFLMELSAHREVLHGQSLYGMIQGGMPYPHTHESGLSMLQIFCRKCNISYQGGFIMGLGAILDGKPLTNLPNSKRVMKQLNQFFRYIKKDETAPREVYLKAQFRVPAFIYGIMAKGMNRIIDRDLKKHGIDVKQESPYQLSKLE